MTYLSSASPWIVTHTPRPEAKLKLICFPFAGGSASFYHDWSRYLPENIEISSVELPGRGMRFGEPLLYHISTITKPLLEVLKPLFEKQIMFFGHSLGAILGFEVACRLQDMGYTAKAFIASGCRAPCIPQEETPLHALPDELLVAQLNQYNGTPSDVLNDPDILALFLPIIRADLQVNETYDVEPAIRLKCPICAFAGESDREAAPSLVEPWQSMTDSEFNLTVLSGGHFFLKENQKIFMLHLNKYLAAISNK